MQQSILSLEPTKKRESSDPYYDLIEDFELIIASFQSQYGIRLSKDLRGMKWDEFSALLAGLDEKTVLGRVISIRAEDDLEVLKHFTKHEHKIRNEYRGKRAKQVSEQELTDALEQMKEALISMAGGGTIED